MTPWRADGATVKTKNRTAQAGMPERGTVFLHYSAESSREKYSKTWEERAETS